jgi:hypothetical protein|uniref:Uncharacterized protein n=1 Tax=Sipha flava TaxID=143950 RepID=A0A2S2R582_9HEMI
MTAAAAVAATSAGGRTTNRAEERNDGVFSRARTHDERLSVHDVPSGDRRDPSVRLNPCFRGHRGRRLTAGHGFQQRRLRRPTRTKTLLRRRRRSARKPFAGERRTVTTISVHEMKFLKRHQHTPQDLYRTINTHRPIDQLLLSVLLSLYGTRLDCASIVQGGGVAAIFINTISRMQ